MKTIEFIQDSKIKVALRKDFYDVLRNPIRELLDVTGANYFSHQIIENYYQTGHFVSSFNAHEDWLDTYWSEFWDNDPFERKIHKNAKINGFTVSLWQLSDPDSKCMETRMKMCKVHDGVGFSYQHKSGAMENFTIAWSSFDLSKIDINKLELIQEKLNPIRQHHRQVYQDVK
jgi:hypothetical protein